MFSNDVTFFCVSYMLDTTTFMFDIDLFKKCQISVIPRDYHLQTITNNHGMVCYVFYLNSQMYMY